MEEPSPRSSRLALTGALLAAIALGGAGFLLGRSTSEEPPPAVVPAPASPAPKPAPEPVASGVLGRADLVALAAAAADAAAAGREPGPQIAQAAGRRFELRLPFGCNGPSAAGSKATMGWRYDSDRQALRVRVDPVAWQGKDWWAEAASPGIEAVEGFWIARPWTSSEICPQGGEPAAAGVDPVTLPGQTLAIGQIFFAGGERGGRRDGKAYEAVVRVPEDEFDASRGFRLRISGRIAGTPGPGPVGCRQAAGPEQRPICLISVIMDEVALENPVGGQVLATWALGGPGRAEP